MISFFKFLFGLIILLLIAAVLLYMLNKPLFKEFQERILRGTANSSLGQNKNRGRERAVHASTLELQEQYSQIEYKVSQTLNEISALQHAVEGIMAELDAVSRNVSNLCSQFSVMQEQRQQRTTTSKRIPQDVSSKHETQDKPLQQMYAYAPSSSSPYGFTQDDWSVTDNGQIFVMKMISDTEAKFAINPKAATYSQVMNNLAYLDRLIEYENIAAEDAKPTRINCVSLGRLLLQDSVWTIQNKIKIKID